MQEMLLNEDCRHNSIGCFCNKIMCIISADTDHYHIMSCQSQPVPLWLAVCSSYDNHNLLSSRLQYVAKVLSIMIILFMLISRCREWMNNTRRGDSKFKLSKVDRVRYLSLCEEHFEARMFMNPKEKGSGKKVKRLVHNAVPTLFDVPNPALKAAKKCVRLPPAKRSSPESGKMSGILTLWQTNNIYSWYFYKRTSHQWYNGLCVLISLSFLARLVLIRNGWEDCDTANCCCSDLTCPCPFGKKYIEIENNVITIEEEKCTSQS